MTERLQHLDEIEQCIWSELERCVAPCPPREADEGQEPQAPHDLRIAALATADAAADGDSPGVVLREVDAPERRLVFYTDARAPELRRLESHPEGTLTFRSRRLGWQLRMRVRLAVEKDGLAVSSRWARLQTRAGADDYRAAAAPGSPLDPPLAALGVRAHFALIEAMAESVEWAELDPSDARRAECGADGPRWV
jgi:hypothetical protein